MTTLYVTSIAEVACMIVADRLILDPGMVTPESRLRADLKANDQDVQELLRDLTDAFGVQLEGHFFGEVKLSDVVLYIETNMEVAGRVEHVTYCAGDEVKTFPTWERAEQ